MSFTLKSIELNNIRAHEHFIFEPALDGVTAISGDNGAGKSTIVDALAWALYGTRPNNIRNKLLIREGVNPREHKVSAIVILTVGGIEYTVERKLTSADGASECNVWGRVEGSDEETKLIAGPAVSHVEKFIKKTLNLNEKGFLTSVLIQQKQVDQIVSASPRERGQVIEEMTGISKITYAMDLSNEQMRDLQKTLKVMPNGDVDGAKNKVSTQIDKFEDLKLKEDELSSAYQVKQKEVDVAKVDYAKVAKVIQSANILKSDNELLKKSVDMMNEQVAHDFATVEKYKKNYGGFSAESVDVSHNELSRTNGLLDQSRLNKTQSTKMLEAYVTERNEIMAKGVNVNETEALFEKLHEQKKTLNDDLIKLTVDQYSIAAELKSAQNSLKQLDSDDITMCPVCKSEIHDPEELREEIKREISELTLAQKANKTNKLEVSSTLTKVEADMASAVSIIDEQVKLNILNERDIPNAEELLKKHTLVFEKHQAEVLTANEAYQKSLKAKADYDSFMSASERLKTSVKRIAEDEAQIKSNESKLSELNPMSDRSFVAYGKRIEEDSIALTKLMTRGREVNNERKLAKERLNDFEEALKREENILTQYNSIAEQVNQLNATSITLGEFKKSHVENSIPMLEFYASDFLSKFTGGAFSRMSLDEKFNASVVTDAGITRPISQLSGGELSSAAIALRLGISLLLNGTSQGLVILDEVLVSMDEDRARQIMETIASITNSQVIFIAHNTAINSIADKTVHVRR